MVMRDELLRGAEKEPPILPPDMAASAELGVKVRARARAAAATVALTPLRFWFCCMALLKAETRTGVGFFGKVVVVC